MHKQIDKLALKSVNKVLKQHNCRVILASGSKARYLIQRKRVATNSWGAKPGSVYAIGLAYGEALLDVLKDPSLKNPTTIGGNGWYLQVQCTTDPYNPPVLDEREMLQVELALA